MFTFLNGERVEVIVDDGIDEQNNANNANLEAGEYSSDVYLVPLSYMGNRDAMRIDYKDYRFINGEIAATQGLIGPFYRHTPDGRFLWNIVQDGRCFKIQAEIEPRIILKTPQLAARIQNVKYVPLQHLRVPDPNDTTSQSNDYLTSGRFYSILVLTLTVSWGRLLCPSLSQKGR
jgi:hypothetical protein